MDHKGRMESSHKDLDYQTSLTASRRNVFHKNSHRKNFYEEKFGNRAVNFAVGQNVAWKLKLQDPAESGKSISQVLLEKLERETNESKWNQGNDFFPVKN